MAVEDEKSSSWQLRKICCIFYIIILEVVGIGCLSLAIFSLTYDPIQKLRIWTRFDETVPNFPPILAIVAAAITIASPAIAIVGIVKRNQILLIVFCGLVTAAAFAWFGIGGWCVSMHKLIIDDIPLAFARLARDGDAPESDARQFLIDLRANMPLINNQLNFLCCPNTIDDALPDCAQGCGERYEELFQTIIFPSLYSVLFGAGALCLLSLVGVCLVSCHLDEVRPAL